MDESNAPMAFEQGRITIVWGLDADDRAVHLVQVGPSPEGVPYMEAAGALAMAVESLPEVYAAGADED